MAINTFQTASPQTAMATQLYGSALLNKRNLFNDMYNTLFDNKEGIVPQWDMGAKRINTSNIMRDAQRLHQDEVNSYLENGGSLLDWLDENYDSKDGFLYNREDPNLYTALGAKQNAVKNQNTQQLYDNIMGLNNEQMNERLKAGDNFYSWFNNPKYATPTAEMRQSIDNKIANQQEMNRANYQKAVLNMSDAERSKQQGLTANLAYGNGNEVSVVNTDVAQRKNKAQDRNNSIQIDNILNNYDEISDIESQFKNLKDANGNSYNDNEIEQYINSHGGFSQAVMQNVRDDIQTYFKDNNDNSFADAIDIIRNTDASPQDKAMAYNIIRPKIEEAVDSFDMGKPYKKVLKKQLISELTKKANDDAARITSFDDANREHAGNTIIDKEEGVTAKDITDNKYNSKKFNDFFSEMKNAKDIKNNIYKVMSSNSDLSWVNNLKPGAKEYALNLFLSGLSRENAKELFMNSSPTQRGNALRDGTLSRQATYVLNKRKELQDLSDRSKDNISKDFNSLP
jgi:hypothetical protein